MHASPEFHLVSHWRVEGTPDEVAAVLTRPEDFPRWWGDVYLAVREIAPGDASGIGRAVEVRSKGWLPYRLTWRGRLLSARMPETWEVAAEGDLVGRGVWTLKPDGRFTNVTYDWRVIADRPLFRLLAPMFKWLMVSNHQWAMAKGEAGLKRELARRYQRTLTT